MAVNKERGGGGGAVRGADGMRGGSGREGWEGRKTRQEQAFPFRYKYSHKNSSQIHSRTNFVAQIKTDF